MDDTIAVLLLHGAAILLYKMGPRVVGGWGFLLYCEVLLDYCTYMVGDGWVVGRWMILLLLYCYNK